MVARRLLLPMMLCAGLALAAGKDECPHGQLDPRYCDRNGDLIADAPSDSKQWVDPAELIFAYTPVEDPGVYKKTWLPFLDHLKKVTGKPVSFYAVQSNAAGNPRRCAPGGCTSQRSTPAAFHSPSTRPASCRASRWRTDGHYGYRWKSMVRSNDQMKSPKCEENAPAMSTSPTSNSGYKAPAQILENEFKLEVDRDYQAAFSGKHDNSILGVLNRDYDAAAAIANVMSAPDDRSRELSWPMHCARSGQRPAALRPPTAPPTTSTRRWSPRSTRRSRHSTGPDRCSWRSTVTAKEPSS
ncbi:MAG: PhnD/SsuA/transferrin family substrate-binding protein [Acidobacteriota bacterium]